MYEIRPETVKTFITDRSVKLPRFQRKQTWDEKKNFQLCISLFKEYPIGVCILSAENNKKWLLDGRQRKNALTLIYEDPENIYNWSKKFIGFKNSDQPLELEEKFWTKIFQYIEYDPDLQDDDYQSKIDEGLNEQEEVDYEVNSIESSNNLSAKGLSLLLEIIKIIHNKTPKGTGFSRPFDLTKYINRLPYAESINGSLKLSSKKLKTFLDEYRRYCDDEDIKFNISDSFIKFLDYRFDIKEKNKMELEIKKDWEKMYERIVVIEKIDGLLSNSKIGMIEVKDLSPSDYQKIFNIINSEGEKLTAVEILSAKPNWNIPVENPNQMVLESVSNLYKRIGTSVGEVVRWDLPATLLSRLEKNIIIKDLKDSKSDFNKEITLGFKILAGLYQGGVKKEDIEALSKNNTINWSIDIENLIYDLGQVIKLIESFNYFKYLKTWRVSIMELTSDAIALNFLIISYQDWIRKGKPIGSDIKTKQFQKNCFILFDKLIFEYINRLWRGSSDSKIANNIENLKNEHDMFVPIEESKWQSVLNEIYTKSSIDGNDITLKLMKPILYHFYSLSNVHGPDTNYGIEIDHIIPQSLFAHSTINRKEVIKDNILNLGLLPKDENISKGNKKLVEINEHWLKDQIKKYEFINEDEFTYYSNINNVNSIFEKRKEIFDRAFLNNRNEILNN
ncbi:DUF262 domain-containing protein [Clostridium perfringens]|uniref:DUF262 domain-containing protein n=1 Tax=Clostridium perfringens TaxID=1502 RepID=UPI0035126170